jgi:hypothetical protein
MSAPALAAAMPNFFLIGAAKAGTTALDAYLRQHPDVFMSAVKEPHFFSIAWDGRVDQYVTRFFRGAESFAVRGEASASYLSNAAEVAPRMRTVYGDADVRFAVLLRDPVARAWSHYLHRRRNLFETESFETALALEDERLRENPRSWAGYYRDSRYARLLHIWFEHFPRERFLILLTTDLAGAPEATLESVWRFLGVRSDVRPTAPVRENEAYVPRSRALARLIWHPPLVKPLVKAVLPRYRRQAIARFLSRANARRGGAVPKLPADAAARLRARLEPDVADLEALLGRSLAMWRVPASEAGVRR